MIEPKRALVRPRVQLDGGAVALLEEEVGALVQRCASGTVAILGSPGSGKTTALEHLAAVLPADGRCVFFDEPMSLLEAELVPSYGLRVVAGVPHAEVNPVLATYTLRNWTRDDVIEYLLATDRERCASVVARLTAEELGKIGGLPQLCRIVCDEMAADETIQTVADALRRHVTRLISDRRLAESARDASLVALALGNPMLLMQAALPEDVVRVLRHRPVQLLLAAEALAASILSTAKPRYLNGRLPRDLVQQAAQSVRDDSRLLDRLKRLLTSSRAHQPMAASILHYVAALPGALCRRANLRGAYLDGVVWPKVSLLRADLAQADLSGADLRGAHLAKAVMDGACLVGAQLTDAMLMQFSARRADFSRADLSLVKAEVACFDDANLVRARLDRADLRCATFFGANLEGASFVESDLSRASFATANLAGADFSNSRLDRATLRRLQLRETSLSGASLTDADLTGCDLERVQLSDVDFTRADLHDASLSGSVMRGVDFTRADLRKTGLAEIDWEGACLRGADLRWATFHMGGSRSGLVGSPIASEGSRTGFYTDEFEEQHFKSPEEIRKANLCGVDLRGAFIDGVDFYLVDLRGAKYDPDQEHHLRRSGAILEARV
jgi:uncharacterized protein YjbI with pentapeptide repeats